MKTDENKKGGNMSPAKKGLFVLLFSVLIAAAIFTAAYMPWKTYRELELKCTEAATGIVLDDGGQEKDGVYYYGPALEYAPPGSDIGYRTEAVNTVKLSTSWEKSAAVSLYYNPADNSEIILRDEHTAENRFRAAAVISAVLLAAGIISVIAGCAATFARTRPKKYETNLAGQSFEEWQNSLPEKPSEDKTEDEDEGEKESENL